MLRIVRNAIGLIAAISFLSIGFFSAADASSIVSVRLTLINGWKSAPDATARPAAVLINGIVHLKGAISTSKVNTVAFMLPDGFIPSANVYVPVDMCSGTHGQLLITADGTVSVQAETSFSNAQCFTSLDGASFALSATSYTPLHLKNGWVSGVFGTEPAGVRNFSGVVHLEGGIATNSKNALPFILPPVSRPTTNVYVPVDMCNATTGELVITPAGIVTVVAETSFSFAQCLTSLDGVAYPVNANSYSPLTLINGWTNAPSSTRWAGVRLIAGVVQFQGAIATVSTNSNASPFLLPFSFRPKAVVYVPVVLCNATKGRLVIGTGGNVTVQAENGTFSNAQCMTSLEGVSFHL
ncbi:MAG TPA: hypothetical protein VK779_00700 [Rhizomicrobium sp.]|jgi:hypothetical protein|nr:hypothetical protein [Rhizomicrobium sp.]